MLTLTNNFHNTSAKIAAKVGDTVTKATVRRVRKALCPASDCKCGESSAATRGSRITIQWTGTRYEVVDSGA